MRRRTFKFAVISNRELKQTQHLAAGDFYFFSSTRKNHTFKNPSTKTGATLHITRDSRRSVTSAFRRPDDIEIKIPKNDDTRPSHNVEKLIYVSPRLLSIRYGVLAFSALNSFHIDVYTVIIVGVLMVISIVNVCTLEQKTETSGNVPLLVPT